MKKNILLIVVLSLSVMSVAFASTESYSPNHLGEQKLSETASEGIKCEFAKGLTVKGSSDVASAPASAGSKAGIAK